MVGQAPHMTVSEFVAILNQSMDMIFPQVIIVGEISNYRVSKGQWVYFDLKDESSSVKFFGSVHRLPGPLEDGMVCEVHGHPRLHNRFGFSVNYDIIKPVGEGALRKARDLLLAKLEGEGLFAPERKRSLPYPPQRIGLVTSAESAAIADFHKIITARWPALKIELIDTLVQGAQAPGAIVRAIQDFNQQSDPPEVLVIIRGGGSADDLAAFSDESVVRTVAASRIPTVVAIGHENDVSLAELAADLRGSTPSNAAELLVPDVVVEQQTIGARAELLNDYIARRLQDERSMLKDHHVTLTDAMDDILQAERTWLNNQRILLEALDPLQPLERGYALVRNKAGAHIKKSSELKPGEVFSIQFTDDKKQAQLTSDE